MTGDGIKLIRLFFNLVSAGKGEILVPGLKGFLHTLNSLFLHRLSGG